MKQYTKPEASAILVPSKVIRMFTREGFAEVFYEELCAQRKINPTISCEKVFDDLNSEFYCVFNELRYSSYDSFRIVRDKK